MSYSLTSEMSAFKAGYGNMLSLTMEVKHAGILSKTRTGAGNEGAGCDLKGHSQEDPMV